MEITSVHEQGRTSVNVGRMSLSKTIRPLGDIMWAINMAFSFPGLTNGWKKRRELKLKKSRKKSSKSILGKRNEVELGMSFS